MYNIRKNVLSLLLSISITSVSMASTPAEKAPLTGSVKSKLALLRAQKQAAASETSTSVAPRAVKKLDDSRRAMFENKSQDADSPKNTSAAAQSPSAEKTPKVSLSGSVKNRATFFGSMSQGSNASKSGSTAAQSPSTVTTPGVSLSGSVKNRAAFFGSMSQGSNTSKSGSVAPRAVKKLDDSRRAAFENKSQDADSPKNTSAAAQSPSTVTTPKVSLSDSMRKRMEAFGSAAQSTDLSKSVFVDSTSQSINNRGQTSESLPQENTLDLQQQKAREKFINEYLNVDIFATRKPNQKNKKVDLDKLLEGNACSLDTLLYIHDDCTGYLCDESKDSNTYAEEIAQCENTILNKIFYSGVDEDIRVTKDEIQNLQDGQLAGLIVILASHVKNISNIPDKEKIIDVVDAITEVVDREKMTNFHGFLKQEGRYDIIDDITNLLKYVENFRYDVSNNKAIFLKRLYDTLQSETDTLKSELNTLKEKTGIDVSSFYKFINDGNMEKFSNVYSLSNDPSINEKLSAVRKDEEVAANYRRALDDAKIYFKALETLLHLNEKGHGIEVLKGFKTGDNLVSILAKNHKPILQKEKEMKEQEKREKKELLQQKNYKG